MTIMQQMVNVRAVELQSVPAHLSNTELQSDWIQSRSECDEAQLYRLDDEAGECRGYMVQERDNDSGEVFDHIHDAQGDYVQERKYLAVTILNQSELMQ